MRIAIPVSGDNVGGPGESSEIVILDSERDFSVVERYENPALTATSARGISMVVSALNKQATALIVGHIGDHAFSYAGSRIRIYGASGLTLNQAIESFKNGDLEELKSGNGGHHHH